MVDGLKKNSVHRVLIEGYSSEGLGIAHIGGMAVFVHGALRGETCDVKILKVLKNAAFAKAEAVIFASPERTEPKCPIFSRCGGCGLQHMSYGEELRFKKSRVEDALKRIGGLDVEISEIIGADDDERYRNKAQYRAGYEGGRAATGFYRQRTHDLIRAESCLIQNEDADRAASAVREWMDEFKVPAYDEKTEKGLVRHVYVRTAGGQTLVCVVAAGGSLPGTQDLVLKIREACPDTAGVLLNINRRSGNVVLGDKNVVLWGRDYIEDTLCGLKFKISPQSFFQINRKQAERLYEKAAEYAGLGGSETVLDLYCGTGTITLIMARRAKRAIGAEIVAEAIEDAKENARRNGIENAEFICADASEAAAKLKEEGLPPDVFVVDPPRKGLSEDVIGSMLEMAPKRIVYVSCDPATLARDLGLICKKTYKVEKVTAVDMFPRTAHVETVVLMSRVEK